MASAPTVVNTGMAIAPGVLYGVLVLLLAAVAVLGLTVYRLSSQLHRGDPNPEDRALRHQQMEAKLRELELGSLQYKLNPHLFKNTLNTIQSHAYQTYFALDKLANVLDYILYDSGQRFVSLKEELNFASSLIDINRLKLSPLFDLRVKQSIDTTDPVYEQKLVAPLITVDLIENAFKHADLQREDAFIAIVFELRDHQFLLTVSNKISPKPPLRQARGGFGKEALQKRLEILYGTHFTLDQFVENDVYIAHLKIDLRAHKAAMHTAG
ncbi:sensor histidine kinase [Parachryseolinea silvisoli]|jgi:LytS/YehU family sensor histidine kinase|uniref:sensor histidine kinase n=1 Tax=Parachryseolinea silvisoli TaxID=2873601 RepID=UPI002265ECEB|nr:histidine kinase [Parachryseolinea silvisoli]